jgi:putative Holliday junction resolvase
MRTLGIDFGERRIGLAISDPDGRLALPWRTLERSSDARAIAEIAALVEAERIEAIALGEPRRPADGAATAAARRVRGFGEKLARATGRPLEWIDETLTSREADERLREAGVPRAQWAARRDAVAAQIVLQEALDRRARRAARA